MSIYQYSILKNHKQNETLIATRWANYQEYIAKIEFIRDIKEEKYQDGFLQDIFVSCLGYTLDTSSPNDYNLAREEKNETDSKKADGVIIVDNKIVGVIELKDQKSQNLDKIEAQAFNYHNSHSNSHYIIISNFNELRFYIDKKTSYEKFNLFNLDYEEFKKLHLLLSYESIKDELPLKLKEKSSNYESQISKELYKDFNLFRTHLFDNIVKNNDLDKALLLKLTQKLCDRVIFILFAEDRGLLNPNTIKEIREEFRNQKFTDYKLYDIYKFYFDGINKGNDRLNIPHYNGGLFAKDEILDNLTIDDTVLDMEAQKLSDYDFESEVSINILGHIFEQSLTDLEELQASIQNEDFDKKKTKRKKDGVFYTPEYITKYIVQNTIGKLCEEKREELNIQDIQPPKDIYKLTKKDKTTIQNLESYREWLLNIKILDPACGSGAFLNQALEQLITEHERLKSDFTTMGDLVAHYDIETSILENNLYGVDINEEACEIARLSLWIRTAQKGRILTNLSEKIKCGNSLIDDKNVVENAFVWQEEFAEVFAQGGFDVVIGNPPYVQLSQRINIKLKDFLKNKYNTSAGRFNTYIFFIHLAVEIIKNNGTLSFIIPNTIQTQDYYKYTREYLINNVKLIRLVDFNNMQFNDATVETIILELVKTNCNKYNFENGTLAECGYTTKYIIESEKIKNNHNFSFSIENNKLLERIFLGNYYALNLMCDINQAIALKGDKSISIKKENYKNNYYKLLDGKNINKYLIKWGGEYLDFNIDRIHSCKTKTIFLSNEKLFFRRVSSSLIFTYDDNQFFALNTLVVLNIKEKFKRLTNIKYILSLCNSKLLNYIYINKYKSKKKVFSEIQARSVGLLPIPNISLSDQQPFIQKADTMLSLNKELQKVRDRFYDMLDIEKLSKKLLAFEELEFDEFVKEYAKAKKIKFKDKLEERRFRDKWVSLFESDKSDVNRLKDEIATTDKEIDSMVYALYNLTDEEIKIVEDSVK